MATTELPENPSKGDLFWRQVCRLRGGHRWSLWAGTMQPHVEARDCTRCWATELRTS